MKLSAADKTVIANAAFQYYCLMFIHSRQTAKYIYA